MIRIIPDVKEIRSPICAKGNNGINNKSPKNVKNPIKIIIP